MTDRRRPLVAETESAIRQLEIALADLRKYLNPEDTDCSIPEVHRAVSSLYLDTWVAGPITNALRILRKSIPDPDAAENPAERLATSWDSQGVSGYEL